MLSRDPLLLREWVAIAGKGLSIVSSPCVLHKLGRDGGMGFCGWAGATGLEGRRCLHLLSHSEVVIRSLFMRPEWILCKKLALANSTDKPAGGFAIRELKLPFVNSVANKNSAIADGVFCIDRFIDLKGLNKKINACRYYIIVICSL